MLFHCNTFNFTPFRIIILKFLPQKCISCTEFQTRCFLFPCEDINNLCLLLSSTYEDCHHSLLCATQRSQKSSAPSATPLDTDALGCTGVLAAAEHPEQGKGQSCSAGTATVPHSSLRPCCQRFASTGTLNRLVSKQK